MMRSSSKYTFQSPWLLELKADRKLFTIQDSRIDCDIAIVGGGISGIMTAYQILKHTSLTITLIEANRIAHGSTGHNAGHITNGFERPMTSIIEEYGPEMAHAGYTAVDKAWGLLQDIVDKCKLTVPMYHCNGFTGITTIADLIEHLEQMFHYDSIGIHVEPALLSLSANAMADIPTHLRKFVLEMPHSHILSAIASEDETFIAATSDIVRCTNSALLCEQLVTYMMEHYGDRLQIAENMYVSSITLQQNSALLHTSAQSVSARKVVLCTNGFKNFTINNEYGSEVNTHFQAEVMGKMAYMTGIIESGSRPVEALCYARTNTWQQTPYYYLTTRPYQDNSTLLCIGGPERNLPNDAEFDMNAQFFQGIADNLDDDMRVMYKHFPQSSEQTYMWNGLMCHTPSGIRIIGSEPNNPTLLYNLGCNGIGILQATYGGYRIMQLLLGIQLPPSIFDPVAQ